MRRYGIGTDVVHKARTFARRSSSKAKAFVLAKPWLFILVGVAASVALGMVVRSKMRARPLRAAGASC